MTIQLSADLAPARSKRISTIDIVRGVAFVAMAIYHFAWDLEFFGYMDPGTTAYGGWKIFARSIASSFLFLVGVSLVMAYTRGFHWGRYWRRLAMVAAAALLITVATWFAMPNTFIFFGILHQITLASVLGIAFLRLPPLLTLVIAVLVIAAPQFLRADIFNHPALWWVGLSTVVPRSNDYVPLFPWFGAVLAGIGVAGLAQRAGLFEKLAAFQAGAWSRPLTFVGRHGLAAYLIHQPVLISLVWAFAQFFPAQVETREVTFLSSCQLSCEQTRDTEFCARYCACVLDDLQKDDSFDRFYAGEQSAALTTRVRETTAMCTARSDSEMQNGGVQ